MSIHFATLTSIAEKAVKTCEPIHNIAFGPDGSLYVLKIASDLLACELLGDCNRRLTRLAPDGTRPALAQDLLFPGGVAVYRSGQIFITFFSTMPGMGMVVQVP